MIAQLLERELNFSFESNVFLLKKMRLYAYSEVIVPDLDSELVTAPRLKFSTTSHTQIITFKTVLLLHRLLLLHMHWAPKVSL